MPTRTQTRCPTCKRLHSGTGKCGACSTTARQATDRARGSAAARGYGRRWTKIRASYLRRHPVCCLCPAPAEVPDHYPTTRRELVGRGVSNPDADEYLRPLCRPCHSRETAAHQPGGWNRR